jgi:uncharacterized protein YcnI
MTRTTTLFGLTTLLAAAPAAAHVSIASGVGFSDTNQEITFGVGHGCEGHDTRSVRIEIPPEVVSVRALNSDLGPATVELDAAGLVAAVSWEKPEAELLDADTNYYKLVLRLRVPNTPFQTLYFPAYQTCQSSDGTTLEVAWISTGPGEDEESEPAAALRIVPKRFPGWNRFTIGSEIDDLSLFFGDAAIVWRGDAAYSPNPVTVEAIGSTPDVTELGSLAEGDEIWVKY